MGAGADVSVGLHAGWAYHVTSNENVKSFTVPACTSVSRLIPNVNCDATWISRFATKYATSNSFVAPGSSAKNTVTSNENGPQQPSSVVAIWYASQKSG